MFTKIRRSLALKVLPIVCVVIALKLGAHAMGWEVLSVNPLFSGIIAANVFLMGFLISGVLSDFKESERLPSELVASIETIMDEAHIIYRNKNADSARQCLEYMKSFTTALRDWFHKRRRTQDLLGLVHGLNDYMLAFEPLTQANFIVRMKQEQSNLRRTILRIHTIRETSFVSSGYTIATATTFMLTVGLILSKITPFHESLFFVFVICFLLIFLLALIHNLDNPFGHYDHSSLENVSLKVLDDLILEMETGAHLPVGTKKVNNNGDSGEELDGGAQARAI